MRKLYGYRALSAGNIAVGQKIREIREKQPGISPQQAMSMASKAVAGHGLYLAPHGMGYKKHSRSHKKIYY